MTIEIKILTAPGCSTCDQAKALVQKFVEQEARNFPDRMVVAVDAAVIKEFGLARFAAHDPANHTINVIDPALFIHTGTPGMPRDR